MAAGKVLPSFLPHQRFGHSSTGAQTLSRRTASPRFSDPLVWVQLSGNQEELKAFSKHSVLGSFFLWGFENFPARPGGTRSHLTPLSLRGDVGTGGTARGR